jgi:hypothetical protein
VKKSDRMRRVVVGGMRGIEYERDREMIIRVRMSVGKLWILVRQRARVRERERERVWSP